MILVYDINENSSGLRIWHFREEGKRPFADFDFGSQNIYKASRLELSSMEEQLQLVEDLVNIKGNFEFWVIPTVINVREQWGKFANNDTTGRYFSEVMKTIPGDIKISLEFVIINKKDDEYVTGELTRLGFRLSAIDQKEAAMVTVSYDINSER